MLSKMKRKPLIVTIVLASILLMGVIFFQLRTYPLGNQVEYLGKIEHGTWSFPFTDSSRYDTYFYGTDMSADELASYFQATISGVTGDPNASAYYYLRLPSGQEIDIRYYHDKNNSFSSPPQWAKNTSKKYFFFIHNQDYEALKNSLNK